MTSKCPKCDRIVSYLKYQGIEARPPIGTGPIYKAVNLVCPICSTILGATFDPIALNADLIKKLKA